MLRFTVTNSFYSHVTLTTLDSHFVLCGTYDKYSTKSLLIRATLLM